MMDILSLCRRAAFLPLVVLTAGCGAGIGTLGTLGTIAELLGTQSPTGQTPEQVQIVAEVRRVDMDRQVIQVSTPEGRAGGVAFDLGTEVVHEQQPYPIASLDRGDVVTLHLRQADPNTLYASRIELVERQHGDGASVVTADAADAADAAGAERPRRLEGEVVRIDRDRGSFELETPDHGTVTVTLPYNPPAPVKERFDRLRSGDVVRLEGDPLGGARIELQRFL